MGKLVFIMGRSGTGKSHSMKNIPADRLGVINIEGKDFPFGKKAPAFGAETINTDNAEDIITEIDRMSKKHDIIVVDDFQYLMANEFMRRVYEKGYDKWNEIARHAFDILKHVSTLSNNVIVYVFCHTDKDDNGYEKVKTLGKMLDDKIVLEGMSTIVLKSECVDGKYYFFTQNSGQDTVKSPEDMFPSRAIPNDLLYVDDKIRNYWGMDGAKSDEEIQKDDQVNTVSEDSVSAPKRTRRSRRQTGEKDVESKVDTQTTDEIMNIPDGEEEEVPFEDKDALLKEDTYFKTADGNYIMKHAGDVVPENAEVITKEEFVKGGSEVAQNTEEAPVRRRRRRG